PPAPPALCPLSLHDALPISDKGLHRPSEYLGGILRQAGATEGIDEERLREIWTETAGDFVARHAMPQSLRNGCLTLVVLQPSMRDRKSTRLNSSHVKISYAV